MKKDLVILVVLLAVFGYATIELFKGLSTVRGNVEKIILSE